MTVRPDPAGLRPSERRIGAVVRGAARVPGLRRFLLWRPIAAAGFGFASACAFLWGTLLGGRHGRGNGIRYISGLPRWAYGRGGTTIGGIFLTTDQTAPDVLEHEAVHRAQWKKYGLAFIPLYLAAGSAPLTNRFEVEAGLEKGGYLRARPRSRPRKDVTRPVRPPARGAGTAGT